MSNIVLVGLLLAALGPLSSGMETDSGQPTFVDDTKKCSLGEHCNIEKQYYRINEEQSRSRGLPVGSIVCCSHRNMINKANERCSCPAKWEQGKIL